jgi:hypothetical protein
MSSPPKNWTPTIEVMAKLVECHLLHSARWVWWDLFGLHFHLYRLFKAVSYDKLQ